MGSGTYQFLGVADVVEQADHLFLRRDTLVLSAVRLAGRGVGVGVYR